MGKTLFTKINEMISKSEKKEMTLEELKVMIMREIGSDDRTLKRVSRTLTELNLIKEDGGRIIFI